MKQNLIAFFKNKQNIVYIVSILVFAALLTVDLTTKAWAAETRINQPEYFLGFIKFTYAENEGMAWGLFKDNPTAMNFITAFTVVLILGLGVLYFTLFKRNTPARIVLAVIEAGAIGNLIDRVVLDYVRDMVDVSPLGFGICNFADFFITFGGVILLFIIVFIGKDALFPLKKEWREEAKREEEAKNALKAVEKGELPEVLPEELPEVRSETPPDAPSPEETEGEASKHDE